MKKYIQSHQQGGNLSYIRTFESDPVDLPLKVKLDQQEKAMAAKYNRRSSGRSSGAGSEGEKFSDLDNLDEANPSDKNIAIKQLQELDNYINKYTNKFGEEWLISNPGVMATNKRYRLKANLANGQKYYYDLVNGYEEKMEENEAGDAIATPSRGTMLITEKYQDPNSPRTYSPVSYKEFYNNPEEYKDFRPALNSELINNRRTNEQLALADQSANGEFSAMVSRVLGGDKLREGIQEVFDKAGTWDAFKRAGVDMDKVSDAATEIRKGVNNGEGFTYVGSGNMQNLVKLAKIMTDPKNEGFIDPALTKGLYQAAFRSLTSSNIPEDVDFETAMNQKMGEFLGEYIAGVSTYNIEKTINPGGGDSGSGSTLNKIDFNDFQQALLGKTAKSTISSGMFKSTGYVIPQAHEKGVVQNTAVWNTGDIANAVTESGEPVSRETLATVGIQSQHVGLIAVDQNNKPITNLIQKSSDKGQRLRIDLQYMMDHINNFAHRNMQEDKNLNAEKAIELAKKQFYEQVGSNKKMRKHLGIDNTEELKQIFQNIRLTRGVIIEGYTENSDIETADVDDEDQALRLLKTRLKKGLNMSQGDLDDIDDVYATKIVIPISDKLSDYFTDEQTLPELNMLDVALTNDLDISYNPLGNTITGAEKKSEGGKLLYFSDLID